jgi:hypothetical protein
MANFPLLNFNSGELSPQIDSRSDVDKYRSGCRILENMIPRIYGPATRRPGTKYIETVDGVGRVISFIYSNTIAYIILLEDQSMKFYFDGGRVNDAQGRLYKLDTPYLEADLFELQFKQSNDVMWILHSSYVPRKLTRVSANEFTLDEITFTNGPFKKRNDLVVDESRTLVSSHTVDTDDNWVAHWKMESGTVVGDSVGNNNLSQGPNNVTADTADFVQGDASAYFQRSLATRMFIAHADLDSGFPLKSGETNRTFSYTFWLNLDTVGVEQWIISVASDPPNRTMRIYVDSSNNLSLDLSVDGTAWTTGAHASALSADTWYHVGVTFNNSDNSYRIRIYDRTAEATLGVDKTGTLVTPFIGTGSLYFGFAGSDTLDGNLDDVRAFSDVLAAGEIDQIRDFTYLAPEAAAADAKITLTPSVLTGTGTLTASSAIFDAGHIGALFSITQPRVNTTVSGIRQATGVLGGSSILTEGACTLNISDGWSGTIELQRSIDSGSTWETRRSFFSDDGKRAIQYTFDEEESNVLHRVNVTTYNATYAQELVTTDEDGDTFLNTVNYTSKIKGDLTVNSSTQTGICRVTGFVSSTLVTMTVLKDFASTNADTRWAEGSWSTYRGFPTSVTFFEERVVYGGTPHQPQTIWLSATDDYENFDAGTNDDDSFSLTISSETRNAIQWIGALEALLIGTSGGEWRIRSSTDDESLTPTNFTIKQQTDYGSKQIQAQQVGDVILFADFVGRKVREISFSGGKFKYIASDLTALAEHITASGITSMAFQRNPDPILWCTLDDGSLISMTYEREQNVIGWSKHPFFLGAYTLESSDFRFVPTSYPTLRTTTDQADPGFAHNVPISSLTDLENITNDLTANYYLTQDIDASATSGPSYNGGLGWKPINNFTGTLDGDGYRILNLYQNDADANLGFFNILKGQVSNLTLDSVNITATGTGTRLGALCSTMTTSVTGEQKIVNCHVTGTVTYNGDNYMQVGGLIGLIDNTVGSTWQGIYDSTSSATISATSSVSSFTAITFQSIGGLIGRTAQKTKVWNCSATGNVTTSIGGAFPVNSGTGGLIGRDTASDIDYCFATGAVVSNGPAGGLMGFGDGSGNFHTGATNKSYATGNVTGTNAGGFISSQGVTSVLITDCYARGNVTGTANAGGFSFNNGGTNCYSTGLVSAPTVGGLVVSGGSATSSYWDTETSGTSTSSVGTGKPTTEMMLKFTYTDWNFDTIWEITEVLWTDSSNSLGINSIAVIPSDSEDEIWVIVSRVVDGSIVRYLEQFQPRDWGSDDEDQWFLDSALDYDSTATTTFSGLDHLEGEEVAILADGAVVPRQTVTDGTITLDDAASRVIAGLPFRYQLKPMRLDFTSGTHTSQTAIKRIGEVLVSFWKSGNVEYGVDTDNLFKLKWRTEEDYDSSPSLYTGDKKLNPEGGFDAQDSFILTGDDPLNCTVRSIVPRVSITGR